MTLNMAILYPDLLNLHGDRANALAFQKVADGLSLKLQMERIDTPDRPIDFQKYHLILVPPGETVEAGYLAKALTNQREALREYIEGNGVLAVIGTSIAIFGKRTERKRGESFDGLGLVGVNCQELRTAYSNDAVLTTDTFIRPMEIVGGQIQMLRMDLEEGTRPLGRAQYGYGNDGKGFEGLRYKNFFHTNLLGPVFVKNPWFAESILRIACHRVRAPVTLHRPDYPLERVSNREIRRFIAMKIEKYDSTRLYNGED